jgi:CBS domain containing-hemolysin-like protein
MTLFTWSVIIGMILVNALYVAAEFAAVSASRSRMRALAAQGHALAAGLLPVLDDARKLDRYVAACQIGITLSSLVLGAFGQATLAASLTPLFERWGGLQEVAAQSTAALVVLVGLTTLQVVLGELVPKSLALTYPTQLALYTALPMRGSLWLLSGFIAVLNGSGIALLKLLGAPQSSHRHIHSPEEIDLLLAESRDGGLLEPDESERLHRALKLSVRPAHQLMVPRLHMVALDVRTPVAEAVRLVVACPYTRLPVYRDSLDQVAGVLNTRDLVLRYMERGGLRSLEEVLRPALFVPENITADRLLNLLRERHYHQAIVLDEFGGVAGLVTMEDVLAELLGEIGDEFKADRSSRPERLPDGRVRLPGRMRRDEAEHWIGVLWEGEADTVGGHVVQRLGHLPEPGEQVTVDGVEVEVEQVRERAVASVLARPLPDQEGRGRAARGRAPGPQAPSGTRPERGTSGGKGGRRGGGSTPAGGRGWIA